MYGALNDVISRGAGAGDRGGSIIDQVANPDSDFYSDMFARLRIQLEQSEEEKKKQAIIDALDSILKGMQSKDGKDRKDMASPNRSASWTKRIPAGRSWTCSGSG